MADGAQVEGFSELRDDGSTACGCWIYSGVVPEEGVNWRRGASATSPASTRTTRLGLRVARTTAASCTTAPRPTPRASRGRSARSWSGGTRDAAQWTGHDAPDFPRDKAARHARAPDGQGMEAHSGADPFIMNADGRAWLFAPSGLKDGPLPAHYEPFESPVRNALYPAGRITRCVVTFDRRDNPMHGRDEPALSRTSSRRTG